MGSKRTLKTQNALTTGQTARICHVAPRTVCRWFDSGKLKGYRIFGIGQRKILTNEFIRFMKTNNMPEEMLCNLVVSETGSKEQGGENRVMSPGQGDEHGGGA